MTESMTSQCINVHASVRVPILNVDANPRSYPAIELLKSWQAFSVIEKKHGSRSIIRGICSLFQQDHGKPTIASITGC